MPRTYDMSTRSQKAAQTTERIIAATERLLEEKTLDEISLKAIAMESNVTVQTVLRHMETREGCLYAVAEKVSKRVEEQRGNVESGNLDDAVNKLIEHYETEGRLVLNLLAQEHSGDSFASDLTKDGRLYHRKWVERFFGPFSSENNSEIIDGLVAATDIYVWKLLRLDLKRSPGTTKNVIKIMVKGILEGS